MFHKKATEKVLLHFLKAINSLWKLHYHTSVYCRTTLYEFLYESGSCSVVSDCLQPDGLYSSWTSLGQNTGVGSLSLLQQIFPTQGSNPGLPSCRRILYQLSHMGSSRILRWVAYPFSRGSSRSLLELNWGLPHCRLILYQLSYLGSQLIRNDIYSRVEIWYN